MRGAIRGIEGSAYALLASLVCLSSPARAAAPVTAATAPVSTGSAGTPSAAPRVNPEGKNPEAKGAASGAPLAAWASAYARGQWAVAIGLLETIPEASRTGWHWLHLARSLVNQGELVEGFAAYERLAELASGGRNVPGMKDVQRQASAESSALSERIPWAEVALSVQVPAGALVYVDQQWVEPTRLRSPYPVNPGWHTFLLESNGEVLVARRVYFNEGQSRVVPLSSSGLASVASFEASSAPSARRVSAGTAASEGKAVEGASGLARQSSERTLAASSEHTAPVAPQASKRMLTWRGPGDSVGLDAPTSDGLLTSAYVSLGVGAAAALVGTGFAIAAHQARNTSEAEYVPCFVSACDANTSGRDSAWRRHATAAGASYAVGVLGLVTGGILWLVHREQSSSPTSTINIAHIELEPGLRTDGAYLRGRF